MVQIDEIAYEIPALQSFSFKSDHWESWLRRFERFCEASGLSGKSEETQISTLIYSMGDRSEDILKSFALSDEDARNMQLLLVSSTIILESAITLYMTEPSCQSQQEGETSSTTSMFWQITVGMANFETKWYVTVFLRCSAVPEAPDGC